MKLDKVIVFDPNDPGGFVNRLRAELGMVEGEKLEFVAPPHSRTDGKAIKYFPQTVEEFDALKSMSKEFLQELGLLMWDGHEDKKTWIHWVYPSEWYNFIPENYIVTDIFDVDEPFKRGVSDDDNRFGGLPYGFIQGDKPNEQKTSTAIPRTL